MGKRRWIMMADRGAVLFIGIAVGAVLGLSFRTGGKPWQALPGWEASLPVEQEPVAAAADAPVKTSQPVLAPGCGGTFPRGPRVEAALAAHRPLHIGVFGDSFGDGLWAATDQAFRKFPDVKVHQFSHEGTGFTRYRTRDLLQDAKDRVAAQPIDLALISIGANDTQGLFVDGHAAPYMSAAWQKTIDGRVTALVRMLQQRGVAVGWVGLPRMRDPEFDHDIQAMNGFFAKVTCRLGVPFANAVPASQDRQHRFALRLTDPATGTDYLARANDGKHMTFHGYEVISRPVVRPILALLAPPAPKTATSLPQPSPAPQADHTAAPVRHKRPAGDAPKPDVSAKPTDLPTHKPTGFSTDSSTAPAKPAAKAEAKSDAQPDTKPDTKPSTAPNIGPDSKPAATPPRGTRR